MIEFRLRVPLRLKTNEMRLHEHLSGYPVAPIVVPARTTLRAVDYSMSGILVLDPRGQRIFVSAETCREHAYIPRTRR